MDEILVNENMSPSSSTREGPEGRNSLRTNDQAGDVVNRPTGARAHCARESARADILGQRPRRTYARSQTIGEVDRGCLARIQRVGGRETADANRAAAHDWRRLRRNCHKCRCHRRRGQEHTLHICCSLVFFLPPKTTALSNRVVTLVNLRLTNVRCVCELLGVFTKSRRRLLLMRWPNRALAQCARVASSSPSSS